LPAPEVRKYLYTDMSPGLTIRIVTGMDVAREIIFVKASIVYEVKGQTAILAQTDPPLLASTLHKDIIVTYLVKRDEVMARHGFPARIVEFIDYTLSSGKAVEAVVIEKTGEEQPYDVRMFYRVVPTGRSDLSMTIHGTPIQVLDISLGGARVSHDKSLDLQSNAVVNASIEMNGRAYSFGARVLRTWDGESEDFKLRFASMQFTNMDETLQYALSQKIHGIERESLPEESLS